MDSQIADTKIHLAHWDRNHQEGIMKNFCSSCFNQQLEPDVKFVDFGSAWDGGTMRDASGMLISIDDLVICESCLRNAARLIGMGDERDEQTMKDQKEEIKRLKGHIAFLKTELEKE